MFVLHIETRAFFFSYAVSEFCLSFLHSSSGIDAEELRRLLSDSKTRIVELEEEISAYQDRIESFETKITEVQAALEQERSSLSNTKAHEQELENQVCLCGMLTFSSLRTSLNDSLFLSLYSFLNFLSISLFIVRKYHSTLSLPPSPTFFLDICVPSDFLNLSL